MSVDGPFAVFPDPRPEAPMTALLDIFFVHGLGGNRLQTWQKADDAFWPRWLAEEFPACRVYMIGYDSNKFAGFLAGEGASIQDLALMMADQIASCAERAPNTLLIAHSLGGLVIKQMIRRCADSTNSDFNDIARSVMGVAFLGTPHQGAQAAAALDSLLWLFKSKQVKQLAYSDDYLIDLNDFFRSWVSRQGARVRSFYETEKTSGLYIVDKVTANPGILGSDPIAVQANHTDICKPENKAAPVYASMCAMIRQLLKNIALAAGPGTGGSMGTGGVDNAGGTHASCSTTLSETDLASDVLADFEYYTTMADHDRRDLAQKLTDAGRSYAIPDARRKKERFNMALQRHIAQPSAVTRYTQLMADVESRFKRHVSRALADQAGLAEIDQMLQEQVISPCIATHSTKDNEITAGLVDSALYYLAGNCHLAWNNE